MTRRKGVDIVLVGSTTEGTPDSKFARRLRGGYRATRYHATVGNIIPVPALVSSRIIFGKIINHEESAIRHGWIDCTAGRIAEIKVKRFPFAFYRRVGFSLYKNLIVVSLLKLQTNLFSC